MRRRIAVLIALYAFGAAGTSVAQTTARAPGDSLVAVRLKDGSHIVGRLAAQTSDSVSIVTNAGRMTLTRSAITELRRVSAAELHDGAYWPPDPHDTRLFFGPTGRTLSKGSGYFSDLYIFFVNAAFGVTDRLMIGGGMSLVPSGNFFGNNVYYLTPKVAIARGETFNVAAGALVGFAGQANGSAGMYYVAASSGRPDASLTYGVGYAYFNSRVTGDATVMLGGNLRLSRRVTMMTENYLFTGGGGGYWMPMYGVRFIGERLSTDLGFVTFTGRNTSPILPGLPWLGFALKF